MRFKSISEELAASGFRKSMKRETEDYFESKGFRFIVPDMFQSYDEFLVSNFRQDSSKTVKVLSGDSRIYVLRPDITTNILGKIFSKWEGKPPLKVYYNSSIYNNGFEGEIKENYQMGVESLGDDLLKADQEILVMAMELMQSLKMPFVIELGSSKYLDSYIRELNLDLKDEIKLRNLISAKNKDELYKSLEELGLKGTLLNEILDMEGNMEDVINMAKKYPMNQGMESDIDAIENLTMFLKDNNLLSKISLDLSMIPDLDYYDGIIFKGYCQGRPHKVISGGRYDKLTERFGMKVSAIGFMINMDVATQLRYREEL